MAETKRIFIFGAGKVGRALHREVKRRRWQGTLRAQRTGLPTRRIECDIFVFAVRDRDLDPLARSLAESGMLDPHAVCVHVAGALDAEVLAPLRSACAGVAQMHPMISFASTSHAPSLQGGHVHVQGDAPAVKRAKALARQLGMVPRTFQALDTVGYHAAAGLAANGAAALAALAEELLVRAGVARETAPAMLGPLLRSVADNVEALGFPAALTGPVRRGDAAALSKHLAAIDARLHEATALYAASAKAQLPLARALAEAPSTAFDEIERLLESVLRPPFPVSSP